MVSVLCLIKVVFPVNMTENNLTYNLNLHTFLQNHKEDYKGHWTVPARFLTFIKVLNVY